MKCSKSFKQHLGITLRVHLSHLGMSIPGCFNVADYFAKRMKTAQFQGLVALFRQAETLEAARDVARSFGWKSDWSWN